MRWRGLLVLACVLLTASGGARAGSRVRYALVVGNNHGATEEARLDELQHAESEARALRNRLVNFGNFDDERVALVTSGGRQEILAAAKRLAARHRQDRQELGDLPTLFIFFFTGHGLAGKLLTRDQPLTGEDLATMYRDMDASLSVGVFDACFSESLTLQGKGAIATPGFNPLTELPKEVLNAEGSVWFVSSRPDEQSYEDSKHGSLFTYYFLESFTAAQPDGVAITLDEMWEYARRRTSAHAARYGRSQTPVKIVRHLKSRGPLYFSFPAERRVTVRFEPDVEGAFLVQYQHGALVEKIDKPKGQALEVALYEGEVLISRVGSASDERAPSQKLELEPGAVVTIWPRGASPSSEAPGYGEGRIQGKGAVSDVMLTETRQRPTLALQAGYGIALTLPGVPGGLHQPFVGGAFYYGPLALSLDGLYGYNSASFDTWGYQLHQAGLRASAGAGATLGPLRGDLELTAAPLMSWISYRSGNSRQLLSLWLGLNAKALWTFSTAPQLALLARIGAGAMRSQGLAFSDDESYWSPGAFLELGLTLPMVAP